ncbi:MAG: T9SS type A sorting domain-containing protein [Bacteroidetes bacterium]|nr:T9SS type A sorting domain-containing protein [Bacteroidota bacterium]
MDKGVIRKSNLTKEYEADAEKPMSKQQLKTVKKMKTITIILIGVLQLIYSVSVKGQVLTATSVPTSYVNCYTCVGTATWTPNFAVTYTIPLVLNTYSINELSKPIYLTNYNFNIPSNSIIQGVELTLGTYTANYYFYKDSTVNLIYNNTAIGLNKALNSNFTFSPNPRFYGSSTDLWGTTLTATTINSPSFGVAVAVKYNSTQTSDAMAMAGTTYTTFPSLKIFYSLTTDVNAISIDTKEIDAYCSESKIILRLKNTNVKQSYNVRLYDAIGKLVLDEKIIYDNNHSEYIIDLKKDIKGIYYLNINNDAFISKTKKIFVD